MSSAFHINSRETKRQLLVSLNRNPLPFCATTKYLGVTLDKSLRYRRHLESLPKNSQVSLIRLLAGTSWDAGAMNLHTAILAVVHSIAEYCATAWCRSSHTRLIILSLTTNYALWLNVCVPHQRNIYQYLQISRLLIIVAEKLHCQ